MERSRSPRRGAGKRFTPRTTHDDALRLLRRRPRTHAELTKALERLGHDGAEVDATLDALEAAGYVNDAQLARHFISARASRLGHGQERLIAELERRGVTREIAERAWNEAVDSGELAPLEQLRAAIRRRVRGRGKLDSGAYARVYNALLRAGHDAEEIRRELEPYHAGDPFDTPHDDETYDDLP